jgi:hypothetical protein
VVAQGEVLTIYGGHEVPILDTIDTPLADYSMEVPDRPGYVRAGSAWAGRVPWRVGNEPVGHLFNDGAAIVVPNGSWPGARGLVEMVDQYGSTSWERQNVSGSGWCG